ncbi:MAG: hypothetical protein FWD58_07580, partial [Firmicutes bacterium]|nr:hypothetical protein [Bacillota bacterium]
YQLSEDSGADSKTATQSAPPPCVTLGFIPAGRGNDYAKATGLNLDPIKALADILLGEIVYSDYIEVGEMRCLNVCGTGLDVAVLERVAGKSGKITYLRSLIWCIKHFTPYALDVTVNGEKSRHECIMAGVCNGTTFGGGIKLSPLSKTDDGKLDLIIMRLPANGKIMPALFKFQKGKHLEMEYTTHIVCDEVSAVSADESAPYPIQLDGEIYYGKTLSCRVVKGGLRTFKTTNNE